MKSALIYGTCTGKTEVIADKILAAFDGVLDIEKELVAPYFKSPVNY